jgi:hypothetical protein
MKSTLIFMTIPYSLWSLTIADRKSLTTPTPALPPQGGGSKNRDTFFANRQPPTAKY